MRSVPELIIESLREEGPATAVQLEVRLDLPYAEVRAAVQALIPSGIDGAEVRVRADRFELA